MDAILVPGVSDTTQSGCLKEYLEKNRSETKKYLPGDLAIKDSEIFESNIFNITNRLEKFTSSGDREVAFLVLEKSNLVRLQIFWEQ